MFIESREVVMLLSAVHFYLIGYIFVFRHDIFRRIETRYKEVVPLVRNKSLVHGRLFVVNGIISMLIAFILLHLFLVNVSQEKCGLFIDIPITLTMMIFTIIGTVSIFNPEKVFRLYVFAHTWFGKHILKSAPPSPIPEDVYKRQILHIRITGAAWLVAALAWSCILY